MSQRAWLMEPITPTPTPTPFMQLEVSWAELAVVRPGQLDHLSLPTSPKGTGAPLPWAVVTVLSWPPPLAGHI